MNTFPISRREFMKAGLGAGAGVVIGFTLPGCRVQQDVAEHSQAATELKPNAWIRIATDNSITVIVPESEMGQGVMTSIPMLIAEELDANWDTVTYEPAPVEPAFGFQGTGGSTSIRKGWKEARQAGAVARKMFVTAAAKHWQVAESECVTQNSMVVHMATSRQLKYGDLVQAAASLSLPETASLKDPDDFKLIGQSMPSLDAPIKVKGEAVFGLDVTLPDLLVATIAQCPVFGGQLSNFDDSKSKRIPGVKHVFAIDSGVVVVATNYWAAKMGMDALTINWDFGENTKFNSQYIWERLKESLNGDEEVLDEQGDSSIFGNESAERIESYYQAPYQAHATMEPMNCTAHVSEDKCDIWAPTQSPTQAQKTAKKYLPDIATENIFIHTTFLGGGFGRRLGQDYVAQAVQISSHIKKPVKLIWSRSEDMQHDFYRPVTYHRLVARIDSNNKSIGYHHRIVGPHKKRSAGGAWAEAYNFDYRLIDFVETSIPVPIGAWRSVGHSQNAFVVESFVDEIASKMKQDPYEFRLDMLKDKPRHRGVLELAASKSGWGNSLPEGIYRGIALWAGFDSYVAQVAEVSITETKAIKVHRVVCAIDCGIAVNPDNIKAQMESGIVYGLTATIKGKIDIDDGGVVQSNFHDFPLLRIDEMPTIETHIVPSTESPGGIGEPGLPPIAPAVANAVFSATGKRVRELPLVL